MLLRQLLCVLLLILTTSAFAQSPTGRWALRAVETTIMVFEIERSSEGLSATWERPSHFTSDGISFSEIKGPVRRQIASDVREMDSGVQLVFGPDPSADVFTIRIRDSENAEMSNIAFGKEPVALKRDSGTGIVEEWDSTRTYIRRIERPTNPEMTAIFNADQAARNDQENVDWAAVSKEDEARRGRVQKLLDAGELRSGDDFYHAAFVFQHGNAAADYLKAHALAIIAAARGNESATWIAAATLDRYLMSIGQAQIYGTQFTNRGGNWTQEPYQRNLLTDPLREASRVPPLIEQEDQLSQYSKIQTNE
jgi:hypothetical protein